MNDGQVSFRWEIPWLEADFSQTPNYFFRRYAEAGVTSPEFLFVLHLANYKFESRQGQSFPSLATIAEEMDYTRRGVRKLRESLEKKGLLEVTARKGRTNVYSFGNLARRLLELEEAHVGTPVPRGEEPQFLGGRNPSSSEEQQKKNKNLKNNNTEKKEKAVVAPSQNSVGKELSEGKELLEGIGVSPAQAMRLGEKHALDRIRTVVRVAQDTEGIENRAGWTVKALVEEFVLSPPSSDDQASEALRTSMLGCAWRKNGSLGGCPTEENGKLFMPWCKICPRAGAISVAERERESRGNQATMQSGGTR